MCCICDKADFALESLFQLITTADICDVMYRYSTEHTPGQEEADYRANLLGMIKKARSGDEVAIDELRASLLCYMVSQFISTCSCPPMIVGQSMAQAINSGLMKRLEQPQPRQEKKDRS